MPNHITNVIQIKDNGGLKNSVIRAAFLNDKNMVDFNTIVPAPKCLEDFEPHMGIIKAAKVLLDTPLNTHPLIASLEAENRKSTLLKYNEGGFSEEEKTQVDRAVANYKECGFVYWYDWQCDNWGTKWNAYSQPEEGYTDDTTEYRFDTAWSHPSVIIEKISKKLPEVTFLIRYADEDTGSNCGEYEIKNGELLNEDIAPSWSDMSLEQKQKYTKFAFELRHPGTDPREYGYGENWVYSDDVYEAWEKEQESLN